MKRGEMKAKWTGLSEEMMQGIVDWREQHPKATFWEIEEEIDGRLSELRAKMISDTAMPSAQAEWETGADGVVCPKCGEVLEKKGKQKRKLETQGGGRWNWYVNMECAQNVEKGFSPWMKSWNCCRVSSHPRA